MQMTEQHRRRLLSVLAAGCLIMAIPAAKAAEKAVPVAPAAPPAEEVDVKELKQQLEAARQSLDAAATRLAELNMKMFAAEVSGERSSRPMLGVLVEDYDTGDGIRLVGVTPNMGAAQAGLKAGDLLVAVNGYRLDAGESSMDSLHDAMETVAVGDIVAVEYLRDDVSAMAEVTTEDRRDFAMKMGNSLDLDIDLSDLEQLKQLEKLEKLEALGVLQQLEGLAGLEALEMLGEPGARSDAIKLEDVSGDLAGYFGVDEGVVVMSVPDDSPLKAGDVLLSLAGERVTSAASAASAVRQADAEIAAQVLRKGSTQELNLAPDTQMFAGPFPVQTGSIKIHMESTETGQSKKNGPDDDG